MDQEQVFRKYQPQLDEANISQLIAANGEVVSLACRRAIPNGFLVQFATAGGGISLRCF
jgi:hypothetical protein